MSEYQYYEFQAIDRPLTRQEMEGLRALSSRATITPHSFTNVYNWGDFKGDPRQLVERYFDAFVYVTNWGTHQLMFRLPAGFLDKAVVNQYLHGESASGRVKGKSMILDLMSSDEEGGDWEEGEGWMASLVPLRADLIRGDLRCLYLGWLLCAQSGEFDDEEPEPPVPPGLAKPSAPLQSLASFMRIDPELIEVAAQASADLKDETPSRDQLAAWVRGLSQTEKDELLLSLVEREGPHLRQTLLRRYAQEVGRTKQAAAERRRTVGELRSQAEALAAKKQRKEAERRAAAEARRKQQEAAARAQYLDRLAGQETKLWDQVEALVQTSRPKDYERAAALLIDLRDLAQRRSQTAQFEAALHQLRQGYAKRPSFLRQLEKAKL